MIIVTVTVISAEERDMTSEPSNLLFDNIEKAVQFISIRQFH